MEWGGGFGVGIEGLGNGMGGGAGFGFCSKFRTNLSYEDEVIC